MMLTSSTTRVEIYSANLKSLDSKFDMDIELAKVDKPELMMIKNPQYAKLLVKYDHLKGAKLMIVTVVQKFQFTLSLAQVITQ